jgi:anti-anti-sigma regulatory factor
MQKARLAEMRTPFIPVSHDVMVMPLVGTLDHARAEDALTMALEGTAARGARVVILDVTGVKVIDEIVARTLLRMVDALGLLGAEAIVTGIRGEVARTLVEIDADFATKVRTLSTLSAGIKHAFQR